MVGLLGLDSKKYARLLEAKEETNNAADCPDDIVSNATRSVNEYGETVIHQYIQFHKRLTDSEMLEIVKGYQDGKTTYQLAEQYGCCRHTVVNILKDNGIIATKAKAQKKLDVEEVIKLYSEYHTIAELLKSVQLAQGQ